MSDNIILDIPYQHYKGKPLLAIINEYAKQNCNIRVKMM